MLPSPRRQMLPSIGNYLPESPRYVGLHSMTIGHEVSTTRYDACSRTSTGYRSTQQPPFQRNFCVFQTILKFQIIFERLLYCNQEAHACFDRLTFLASDTLAMSKFRTSRIQSNQSLTQGMDIVPNNNNILMTPIRKEHIRVSFETLILNTFARDSVYVQHIKTIERLT